MTNDDKALVDAMTLAIKESIGKQFNATPIHPDPSIGDWAASGGVIDLRNVAEALLPIISGRIEALSARLAEADALLDKQNEDIGILREKLIGIRAEIDDMENPFNGGAFVDAEYGFETAVDQAVNIVTAALENSGD